MRGAFSQCAAMSLGYVFRTSEHSYTEDVPRNSSSTNKRTWGFRDHCASTKLLFQSSKLISIKMAEVMNSNVISLLRG